ncbi:MAG: sulfur carrier protein ThiS [Myxococcota bacterium]
MTDAALEVRVNGDPRHIPSGCTVDGLIDLLGLEPRRVAIAINRDVVPRSGYAARRLETGDRVEILEAVGGGA